MAETKMVINYVPGEECRVAIVVDGMLEELQSERSNAVTMVGNIYVGKVMNVEASIQAAFVDFGVGRNGFLHISDVEPQYFRQGGYDPNRPINPDMSQTPEPVHAGAEAGEEGRGRRDAPRGRSRNGQRLGDASRFDQQIVETALFRELPHFAQEIVAQGAADAAICHFDELFVGA